MKRQREASEVINQLAEYLKKSKTDRQSANHILMEILGVALEIRDALTVKSEVGCSLFETFHGKTRKPKHS